MSLHSAPCMSVAALYCDLPSNECSLEPLWAGTQSSGEQRIYLTSRGRWLENRKESHSLKHPRRSREWTLSGVLRGRRWQLHFLRVIYTREDHGNRHVCIISALTPSCLLLRDHPQAFNPLQSASLFFHFGFFCLLKQRTVKSPLQDSNKSQGIKHLAGRRF